MISIPVEEIQKYKDLARGTRRDILDMIYKTKSPHIGGCFSMVELLIALYFRILSINPKEPNDPNRDRFILSKGHGCPALYVVLAKRGFIDQNTLAGFARNKGTLEQHPTRSLLRGIEVSSGSLGHGLSLGVGMALAAKYDKKDYKIFVFLGDGELHEGSNWEAMMLASHHKLDNLIAIVDYNKLQAMGKGEEIIDLDPLREKWLSFSWAVKEIDGHNFEEIINALEAIPFQFQKPTCIIANTIKGKGVSFMENEIIWHDKCPDEKEYKEALKEIFK